MENEKITKEFKLNSNLTLFQNCLTILLCFTAGVSYNYMYEVIFSTSNDMRIVFFDKYSYIYLIPLVISFFTILASNINHINFLALPVVPIPFI